MSLQIPRPADLPPGEAASADNAGISRKGRKGIGIMLIIVAVFNVIQVIVAFATYGRYLALITEGERIELFISVALGILFILALLGVGVWNLATKATTLKAPLVVALVVTGSSLILDAVSIVDNLATTGRLQGYMVIALQVFVIVQAVRVLRLKPAAVSASVALHETPQAETPGMPTPRS